MKRRLLSLALTLALVLALLPASVLAENTDAWTDASNYDTSWYNTTDTDFTVSTAAQLAGLAVLVNGGNDFKGKTVTLTADADLTDHNWTPIGDRRPISNNVYAEFAGVFNGGGHSIGNMTVNINNNYGGLFGVLTGTVKNVSVSGSGNKAQYRNGGIVGENHGTIENCTNASTVAGDDGTGGIAGSNSGAITNCSNTGSVTAEIDTGGIAGSNSGTITNCSNTGSVTGSNNIGGIAGLNDKGTIANCSNAGTVKGDGHYGSIAGNNNLGSITNCYWLAGTDNRVVDGDRDPVTNCASFTEAQGKGTEKIPSFSYTIGGVTTDSTTLLAALNAYVATGTNNTKLRYWKQPADSYPVLCDTWSEALAVKGAVNISDGNIDNAWDLAQLAAAVNGRANQSGVTYTQTADIDLGLYRWTPIGADAVKSFAGTFDGGEHSINNAFVNESRTGGDAYLGFFNFAIGSTIKNVRLFGNIVGSSTVTGRNQDKLCVGGLVGYMDGTVENCSVSGTVLGIGASFEVNTGGISGFSKGQITDCIVTKGSTVEGNGGGYIFSGGIAGENIATIVHCCNEASVSAENAYHRNDSGGIAGNNTEDSGIIGKIINCWNTGNVSEISNTGYSNAGGIAGDNSAAIQNCYNTGEISGKYIGSDKFSYTYVAGIVGFADGGSIANCYSVGNIVVSTIGNGEPASLIGEILAANKTISIAKNCYGLTKKEMQIELILDMTLENNWNAEISGCATFTDAGGDLTLDGTETENNKLAATKLIDALNAWVDAQNDLSLDGWRAAAGVNGGYPVLGVRHTVTFDANGGTVSPASKSVTYLSTYGTLPVPTQPGYTFDGWYTDATGGTKIEATTEVNLTADASLYARWTAKSYTVTFDANGGTVSPTSATVTYQSPYGALPVPTRSGYRFDGWFTAKTGGTQVKAGDTVSLADDATLYARWSYTTPLKVNLTFDTNGGSAVTGAAVTIGTKPDLSGYTTSKKGFRFGGWFLDKALTQQADGAAVTRDTTLYAKWLPATRFADVSGSEWFAEALDWAVGAGIVTGVTPTTVRARSHRHARAGSDDALAGRRLPGRLRSQPVYGRAGPGRLVLQGRPLGRAERRSRREYEGKFDPDRPVTRAELITLLWRLAGSPEPKGQTNPFTDVAQKDYYYKAVLWAHENGIAQGMKPTAFDPAEPCTRAQLVTFLWRYFSK
jgi:uncharacterized repeat protein (TIGR02543 family)